jgi:hypothetical protein
LWATFTAERGAEPDDQRDPAERPDQIEHDEPAQTHPGPARGGVDDDVRDGQHRREHDRPRARPLDQPHRPQGATALRSSAPRHELDQLGSPQPPGPPHERVAHHQRRQRHEQREHERGPSDPRERPTGDERGRRAAQRLQQDRMAADQRRRREQQHEPEDPLGDEDSGADRAAAAEGRFGLGLHVR